VTIPVYAVRGVVKEYGSRAVLRVAELDVQQGEIQGLVGPSGAGKSTLLRLMGFLERPTSGSLRFLETEYGPLRAPALDVRRRVTMVFQRPVLLNRSVVDNVRYGLGLRGQRDSAGLIEAALRQVGLTEFARRQGRTLSGGELQRVALARAMVLRPDVLLLDEPTANLDPYNVGLIEDILRRLNSEQRTTLVIVTHNVFQARRLAQRVGLLLDGQVIEVAKVEEFFESPKDPRTAAFARGEMVY
jgi:tungstate transport system ATP-binding protein